MHLQLTYNHSEQFTYDATSNISGLAIEVTYVQAPYNSQNYNRYSYCLNNPLKYTDPDGEWIHILVGAIIGSVVGTLTANIKSIENGDNFWKMQWKGLAAGIVGGAVGAATAATGGAAAAHFGATGFAAGAATGAATGAVGGALGGASNAWLNGANFRDGMMAGMQGLWAGAATGLVTGGISGGIDAIRHGGNFWSGDGRIFDEFYIDSHDITTDNNVITSNDVSLKTRMNTEFGVEEGDYGIDKITTEGNKNHTITDKGVYKYGKRLSGGFTSYNARTNSIEIHISPYYANADITAFRSVAGHELIHAYHHYSLGSSFVGMYSEQVAYKYSINTYFNGGQGHNAMKVLNKAFELLYIGNSPPTYYTFPKSFGFSVLPW